MPLRIVFTENAEKVDEVIDFISIDSPSSAESMAGRIEQSVRLLAERPHLGRPAPESVQTHMRWLSVPPYVIFYFASQDALEVVRILHGARQLANHKLYRSSHLG